MPPFPDLSMHVWIRLRPSARHGFIVCWHPEKQVFTALAMPANYFPPDLYRTISGMESKGHSCLGAALLDVN